jgi:hypothetical protein
VTRKKRFPEINAKDGVENNGINIMSLNIKSFKCIQQKLEMLNKKH